MIFMAENTVGIILIAHALSPIEKDWRAASCHASSLSNDVSLFQRETVCDAHIPKK